MEAGASKKVILLFGSYINNRYVTIEPKSETQNTDIMDIQQTINQLGGIGKLQAMVSANNFVKDDNSLTFKFKGNRKMNTVKIELNGMDEYEMTFYKITNTKFDEVTTSRAIASNIKEVFEDETGLLLSI